MASISPISGRGGVPFTDASPRGDGRPAPVPVRWDGSAAVEPVALVHDYLTQRGGAERVVLAMARALGVRAVYTSLYDPDGTFPEFGELEVRSTWLDQVPGLRGHHRAAFPLLAPVFSGIELDNEVTVCSTSGWAHGVKASGRKIVYCHAPARWLYQADRYLGNGTPSDALTLADRVRLGVKQSGLSMARRPLVNWDRRAAQSADRYLVNSTAVAAAVREIYGIDAETLAPPPALDPFGPMQAIDEIEPGFWLCVSRLLPYKNVDAIVEAMRDRPHDRLVVVGVGPHRAYLESLGIDRVTFVGAASDAQLRWCYANCKALITVSYEDFGLTPLEAASFGKPSGALRFGGFLDTILDGVTGTFIESPHAESVLDAMDELSTTRFSAEKLIAHTERFSEAQFGRKLRDVVFERPSQTLTAVHR
jgi:glycosyltransferase involved in cell wall biosynthesis